MRLRTPLTERLGIEVPIFQAGMAGFALPELAAAVSNAGGLGILGGHGLDVDDLRSAIAEVRRLTNRPFGVNLILPEDLRRPATEASLRGVADVQAALNPMRRTMGLTTQEGIPPAPAQNLNERIEVVLTERVPAFSIGLGNPEATLVERFHAAGTFVIAMATTKQDAVALADSGVDAIVAQGGEGGGHRSHFVKPATAAYGAVGTMVLVPEIVDSVKVPVIAAGGVVDGRSLVAALALGAQGALIGTRFLATRESAAVEVYKQALLAAESGETALTDVASGRYARVIRNAFSEGYGTGPVLPFGWQGGAVGDLFQGAREAGNAEFMALWAGQGTGRIVDLPGAGELVARIVREAQAVLAL
jgi:nitronate monooxygenase